MAQSMQQKEMAWNAWWHERTKLMRDDGSQTGWEKQRAVLREKKLWWSRIYGEPYWTQEEKEGHWQAYCESSGPLEKQVWWQETFGEEYVAEQAPIPSGKQLAQLRAETEAAEREAVMRPFAPGKTLIPNPVLFGCSSCSLIFGNRRSCNDHIDRVHDGQPVGDERVKVIFHPEASEFELKACLFANLPLQDKAMLSPTVHSSDMDLCYTTRRLVLREAESEWPGDERR
jgi:hypothetical protein